MNCKDIHNNLSFKYSDIEFIVESVTEQFYVYARDDNGFLHCFAPGLIQSFQKI